MYPGMVYQASCVSEYDRADGFFNAALLAATTLPSAVKACGLVGDFVLCKTYEGLHRPGDVATVLWQARVVGTHAEQRETETRALRRGLFRCGSRERA